MKNYLKRDTLSDYHPQPFIWFLFFLTIGLTLLPFLKIGLTNGDDLEFYILGLMKATAKDAYAQSAGRFYFLITKPLFHVAYLVDNFYLTKAIQYGFLLLSFILFAVVVKKLFKNTVFALSAFLLLLVFLTVTPNYYIPIMSLPLYFTLSFSFFLLSLLLLIKYYESNRYKHLVFSVILATLALLFYENYLMFILFVLVFMFAKNISEEGMMACLKNKKTYKEIIPFIAISLVYVAVYYLYRWHVQTENGFYVGTTIAKDFSFNNFLKFIWNPNKMALPTYAYHFTQECISANSLLETGHQHNFWYILRNSQAVSIVNALIQCFLFCILFSKAKPDISWKKIGIGALTASVFIFAVHFLLALTEKHNALYYGMAGYVTTYYAYFGITLFIAFLAYACFKLSYRNKYIQASVIAVFSLLFFCASIIISYSNDHLSRDWQHAHSAHLMMEKLIEEKAFDKIPDGAVIYTDNYYQSVSKLGKSIYTAHPDFWTSYIHIKTKRYLPIYTDLERVKNRVQENPQQEIYHLIKYETPKSLDVLSVLSKVNNNSIDFESETPTVAAATANEATVYYYSANKNFIFQFVMLQCTPESTIMINNEPRKVSTGINAIRIENDNKKKSVVSFTLKSDDPFLVNGFAVSTIGFVGEEAMYLYD